MTTPPRKTHEEPVAPVLLFSADGHMDVIHDLAVTDELIDTPDEVHKAFDGLGRPLQAVGPAGKVSFRLTSDQPEEAKLRARVARYYSVYASRHPTGVPPQETDLAAFVRAVANDEVVE
ncbi:hypothetical protein ACGH52_26310 [Streptomyces sp. BBFR25]|uniref:hypothetical protein n=1 Tax=Streptomyces sp. BBFR25 TaxID=3372855 RepID=UPI0037DC89FB